ncbi:MAG TPA: ribonuclease P protein component [Acidimicrobiia bacterium]|nr:ribonuclease P protein component [Acidimicrobiia bacterium]
MPDVPSSRPGEPKAASASPPEIGSLTAATDFRRVLSSGVRRRVGDITVVVAPGVPGRVRVGLVAGKRTGSAVQRNRAKRRLRRALAEASPPAGDYVVMAGPATATAPFSELVEWLAAAVSRQP